jgi:hypothetical protein
MTALAFPKQKRVRNARYLRRVAELPCCGCGTLHGVEARQRMDAHHRTGAGLALKADDTESFSFCGGCHDDFHDSRGRYFHFDKQLKHDFQDIMIAFTKRQLIPAGGSF